MREKSPISLDEQKRPEQELAALLAREREARNDAQTLNDVACTLAAELDLQKLVQKVTDAGTELTGAKFGAFFYNVVDKQGESYLLYTLSGAPREEFEKFGIPRNTPLFEPTFQGAGVVRIEDVLQDSRYGHNPPHRGMPQGHLPVRSYLAVPVVSRSGEVLGGLFFGHPEPGVFTERAERLSVGIAAQAAIAIDNARLYERAQRELADRKRAELAAASLAAIVESSDDAIVSKDLDGVITSWNKGAERLFGYTAKDAIGRSITMLIPPDRCDEEPGILERIRHGQSIDHYETVRRRKDGTLLDISLTVSPIVDSHGRIVGASKIARDITQRKKAEILVDVQRQALQLLAEGAPLDDVLGFLIGVVERHSAEGMLAAITPLNEGGTQFQRGIGPSLPDAFNAAVKGVAVGSPTGLCAHALRRREAVAVHDFNADTVWQPFGEFVAPYGLRSGWSTPIVSSSGLLLGTFANYYRHAVDPTPQNRELVDMVVRTAAIAIERKRAEEAVRHSAERLRFMAESMPQKIFTAKPNGDVDYFNDQWTRFTGLAFEQIKDWGWLQFIHPDDVKENIRRWQHSIDTGEPFELQHRFRRADGLYRWHVSRALPMRDGDGRITMWIGSNTDIDDQKRTEEALRKSQDLLQDKIQDLETFHDVAVNREMKMIELKQELEKLRQEVVRRPAAKGGS